MIAGNGTFAGAKALGWTEIECVVTTLDTLGKTAYAIADNKTSELAEWDLEGLNLQLESLQELNFDITEIGFPALEDFEFNEKEKNSNIPVKLTLTISFEDEDSQQELFSELNNRGYKVKV